MISFSHVYKTYRSGEGRSTHALRDVSINVDKGEFIFLTGPSGAGKTTLFRLLSAFDRPSSGSATVAGYDLANLNPQTLSQFRRRIGVVFQDFRLLKDRTVFENVALPLQIRGDTGASVEKRVLDCLESVGLAHKADEFPETVSGGEQQRISIARALIHQPGLLIADEPTGNLDPELTMDIMRLFERANAQGTTVFVATHDHALVKRLAKRSLKIQSGHIEEGAWLAP